jgi:TRAP-type mannitol/chloroaromatic compound transport system substrate-binding protein
MKRRTFLKKSLAGAGAGVAAGAGVIGCGPSGETGPAVATRPTVRWRLASSFPRSLDTIFGAAEVLGERVERLSEGRFTIRIHPAGEVVPALQVLDAAQQGTVQVGQTASYYFVGKNPALAFDCCVPFGMTARQQAAWLHEGGGLELTRELFADFNVINFPAGNTGAQMGGWFKREIHGVADLKGLRIRIPGLGGAVMDRLGATVQVLAGGDIYPALERGAIDATEWVGPYDDEKLGFYKVAKNYYYPGWWEPGPSLSYYVNREAWDKLPAAYREIFISAARESEQTMQARYDAKNPAALARLVDRGVLLRPFSPDILDAARRAAEAIYEEQAAADPGYRKVYEAWKKSRTELNRWFGTAELAYASYAFLT